MNGAEAPRFLLPLDLPSMEARLADGLPDDPGWQFEPNGTGSAASHSGQEMRWNCAPNRGGADALFSRDDLHLGLAPRYFVLDGEPVIPMGEMFSFDALQMRLHPAESQIRKVAAEIPAILMLFDLLATPGGETLLETPLVQRRFDSKCSSGPLAREAQ